MRCVHGCAADARAARAQEALPADSGSTLAGSWGCLPACFDVNAASGQPCERHKLWHEHLTHMTQRPRDTQTPTGAQGSWRLRGRDHQLERSTMHSSSLCAVCSAARRQSELAWRRPCVRTHACTHAPRCTGPRNSRPHSGARSRPRAAPSTGVWVWGCIQQGTAAPATSNTATACTRTHT
jgi:hypothetical protein